MGPNLRYFSGHIYFYHFFHSLLCTTDVHPVRNLSRSKRRSLIFLRPKACHPTSNSSTQEAALIIVSAVRGCSRPCARTDAWFRSQTLPVLRHKGGGGGGASNAPGHTMAPTPMVLFGAGHRDLHLQRNRF